MATITATLKDQVQCLAKKFYESKQERDFTALCNKIQPIVYSISMQVLKDHDVAMINVNDVFMKIYNNMMGILTDKNSKPFVFKDTPFFSYVNSIAHNKAKMKYNKHKHSGIKYIFEAASEEDDSNNLVDVLPTSSKEYFDMNSEDYMKTFGDLVEKVNKCVVRNDGSTIVIVPDDETEPIPNKVIYKIKERYKKHVCVPLPEHLIIQQDMISFDASDWVTILQNDELVTTFDAENIPHKTVVKMVKQWVESSWLEKTFVSNPKKHVGSDMPNTEFELAEHIHNSDSIKYSKVKNIIGAFNSNTILMDAMVNLSNYTAVAKKHDIGSYKQYESLENPGTILTEQEIAMFSEEELSSGTKFKVIEKNRSSAIKTRVFRSKKTINKIMDSEILYSQMMNERHMYTGNLKLYFDNGKVKMAGHFEQSKRHGKFIFYFDNGCVKKIINYKHNVLDGEYKEYSKSGSIIMEGTYTDGLKHGMWKYYKSKSMQVKIDFYLGIPGYYEKFSNSGNIVERSIYADGCNIGELVA